MAEALPTFTVTPFRRQILALVATASPKLDFLGVKKAYHAENLSKGTSRRSISRIAVSIAGALYQMESIGLIKEKEGKAQFPSIKYIPTKFGHEVAGV